MVADQIQDYSPDIQRLYQRFQRWRSSHTGRLPIPERLWAAAAELARRHGVFRISKSLNLEYGKLKELAGVAGPATKKPAGKTPAVRPQAGQAGGHSRTAALARPQPPAFVELIAPNRGTSLECRVELEGRRGKMRIEFKGIATAELVALGRALWDGEA